MATKSKKTTTTSSTVSSSQQQSAPTTSIEISGGTGQTTASSTRAGTPLRRSQTPTRPVSPGRLSRIQEKNELQSLNDRLAAYIERVRSLETENSKLRIQIQKSMESREIHTIKTMYEVELHDTRQTLDSIAKEKAQLELELSRLREELKVAEAKLAKKMNESSGLEKRNQALEIQIEELKSKIAQALAERKRLEGELRTLAEENKNLEGRLKSVQKQLEEETILRVDLENRNQSLNEELAFQRQLFQNEMEEIRQKTFESKEIHTEELKAQYEERLKYELDELRANMDDMIRLNRHDLEERYELRIGMLQEEMAKKNSELNNAANKIKQLNSSYTMFDSELETLKNENTSMKKRLEDMNKLLSQERDWNKIKMNEKDKEMEEIRRELQRITDDYNDLLDDKIKLDAELEVYRKLLEGEETRLNISLSSLGSASGGGSVSASGGGGGGLFSSQAISSSSRSFIPRGTKRKRIALQDQESIIDWVVNATAKGEVEISDHDVEGKYVRLFNKSDKEISLSGWYLLRRADDLETRYKFHRSIVIKPQSTITIWSSDAGTQIHNPPSDIVMKSQTWFTADTMSTTLFNNNNEEVASRKTEKRITSSFQRMSSGYLNNENNVENNQNCAIM
ncbi:lamin Dm0 [Dermatophagoides farinae]|uniref:lamin Dm0 n=1 Tax=Dermatophagoides farinae TaxID=6954 RepID=UPI003F600901